MIFLKCHFWGNFLQRTVRWRKEIFKTFFPAELLNAVGMVSQPSPQNSRLAQKWNANSDSHLIRKTSFNAGGIECVFKALERSVGQSGCTAWLCVPLCRSKVMSHLRSLKAGTAVTAYSQSVECLCSWGQISHIVELIENWLTEAAPVEEVNVV